MFITVGKNRINLNNINYCTETPRADEDGRPIRALGISFGENNEGHWDLVLKGEEVDIFLSALESQSLEDRMDQMNMALEGVYFRND